MPRTRMFVLLAMVTLSLTVFGASIAFAGPAKVNICHKPGTKLQKAMAVPEMGVRGHLRHGDILGYCPILAGVDTFPSTGSFNLNLGEVGIVVPGGPVVMVNLSSAGLPDAIVERQTQVGTTIETEIVSLQLKGVSPLGPVEVKVGRAFGLPPSTGQITNVVNGSFVSGDSFFDVFFEVTVGGAGGVAVSNAVAVRLDARNAATLEPAPITSLPPNDPADPDNTDCITYAESVAATGLLTDFFHTPFGGEGICA